MNRFVDALVRVSVHSRVCEWTRWESITVEQSRQQSLILPVCWLKQHFANTFTGVTVIIVIFEKLYREPVITALTFLSSKQITPKKNVFLLDIGTCRSLSVLWCDLVRKNRTYISVVESGKWSCVYKSCCLQVKADQNSAVFCLFLCTISITSCHKSGLLFFIYSLALHSEAEKIIN